MRARMKENMLEVIRNFFGDKEGHKEDQEFIDLCERISGKEVELKFIGDDAFEVADDNYWLPDCCWDEIKDLS